MTATAMPSRRPCRPRRGRPPCRHCRRRVAGTARGLCSACYQDRAVRALYPVSPAYRQWTPDPEPPTRDPKRPTVHPPGSPGKVAVMARRLARGERLWHAQDRKADVA